MNENNLTKEEIKAIKHGSAYRNWNRRTLIVTLAALIWFFGGIPLIHINSITSAVYTIGAVIFLVAEFYTIILTSWKCPECKKKLPSKNVRGGTASVCTPQLVKECPHCKADLTK